MWKRYKDGEKNYLSVIYKQYSDNYGGYYIGFPEDGDLYINLYDLGEPKESKEE